MKPEPDPAFGVWRALCRLPLWGCLALIRFYQVVLSPLKGGPCCRFQPTCSEYCRQALLNHGVVKGLLLGVWRICRCHPFYHGPLYDPVPPRKGKTDCDRSSFDRN